MCEGPGAAGIVVCSRSCKRRRGGHSKSPLQPAAGGDVRLYSKGSRKPSKGLSWEKDMWGCVLTVTVVKGDLEGNRRGGERASES